MNRRALIALISGAAAARPLAARAQQSAPRLRRVGVLMNAPADDPISQLRVAAFLQGLQELGWTVGRNLRIDNRWSLGDADRIRRYAAELVALAPDVIMTTGSVTVGPLLQATRSVPIVFVQVTDPVGQGAVASLARPGGNATGFTLMEYGAAGKWLELLKQIAPRVARVAVIRDPSQPSGSGQFGAVQAVAPFLGVEISPVDVRDDGEIERAVTEFARGSDGGLVTVAGALALVRREHIIMLANQHRLPAVYYQRRFVEDGGLISYDEGASKLARSAGASPAQVRPSKPPGSECCVRWRQRRTRSVHGAHFRLGPFAVDRFAVWPTNWPL